MPPKRPFKPQNTEPILKAAKESYSALLLTRSLSANCYKMTDEIYKDIETLIRLHKKLNSDLQQDIKIRANYAVQPTR